MGTIIVPLMDGEAQPSDSVWRFSPPMSPPHPSLFSRPENISTVMFGGVDHTYHKGKLQWIPVTQARFWQVAMSR